MSLRTGALSVARGPEHFRPKAGRYLWQPREWEPPLQAAAYCHTVTLNQISGKILTWPPILTTMLDTSEGEGGVGTQVAAPLQNDLWRSAWIRKDLLQQKLNEPVRSARICKDLQQEQQRLVICNDQHNQANRKHASKEPCQQRIRAEPLLPPCITNTCALGLSAEPTKHNAQLALDRS